MTTPATQAVARALGWAVVTGEWSYDGAVSSYEVWITDPARKDEAPASRRDVTINPIPFTTDLLAAWTLVEYMIANGWQVTLTEQWECVFEKRRGKKVIGYGDTPAAAIVEAFLKVVEATSG